MIKLARVRLAFCPMHYIPPMLNRRGESDRRMHLMYFLLLKSTSRLRVFERNSQDLVQRLEAIRAANMTMTNPYAAKAAKPPETRFPGKPGTKCLNWIPATMKNMMP